MLFVWLLLGCNCVMFISSTLSSTACKVTRSHKLVNYGDFVSTGSHYKIGWNKQDTFSRRGKELLTKMLIHVKPRLHKPVRAITGW